MNLQFNVATTCGFYYDVSQTKQREKYTHEMTIIQSEVWRLDTFSEWRSSCN